MTDQLTNKPKGYAFIEYMHTRDMKGPIASVFFQPIFFYLPEMFTLFTYFAMCFVTLPIAAYKQADGQKIDGRRVLVDVERGRTVPNWRPRRLGGGLGTSRVGGGEEIVGEQQPQGRTSQSEEPSRPREER